MVLMRSKKEGEERRGGRTKLGLEKQAVVPQVPLALPV